MPDHLLFRPPRRQPRLLVVNADKRHLAFLTLDPWELRYAAKHEWPKNNRSLRTQALFKVALIRERPQAVIVPRENGPLRRLVAAVAKNLHVSLVAVATPDKAATLAFHHLPASHSSREIGRDSLLFQTHALAHAALSKLIQTAYAKRQLPTFETRDTRAKRTAANLKGLGALALPRS